MTVQNICELVQQRVPNATFAATVILLNGKVDELVSESELYQTTADIAVADYRPTSCVMALPANCKAVIGVGYYDISGNDITKAQRYLWRWKQEYGQLNFFSLTDPNLVDLSTEIVTVRVAFITMTDAYSVTSLSQEILLPRQFHDGLLAGILEILDPDVQQRVAWHAMWRQKKLDARKYSNLVNAGIPFDVDTKDTLIT